MSERPIQKDDLVIIVRAKYCCGYDGGVGNIHTVTGFYHQSICHQCGEIIKAPVALIDGKFSAVQLSRLKRIDPGALDEDVPEREELTA